MRIAQMIDALNWGGAQKLIVTFAEAVRYRQVELTVIALGQGEDAPYSAKLRGMGVRVVEFPAPKLFNGRRLRQLIQFVRAEKFDIIHTHLTYANILGPIVGLLTGIPVVATLHNVKHHTDTRQKLEQNMLRFGTRKIIAVGYEVAKAREDVFAEEQVVVIPNAVSPLAPLSAEDRMRVRHEVVNNINRPLLVSVGRLVEQKGYGDMLTAVSHLRHTHPNIMLLIAGSGELFARLSRQIQDMDLSNHVRLLGARRDVLRLMAASDMYLSASYWEGLPLAILEAMSAGLPVVATAVGDVPRLLSDKAGVVVPPHQPEQLATAVADLLDDKALMLTTGHMARARVNRQYGPTVWADRIISVYNQASRNNDARLSVIIK